MGEIKGTLIRELLHKEHRPIAIGPHGRLPRRRRLMPVVILIAAAALGGLGAQTIYDRGLADVLQWTGISPALSSTGKPFGVCQEGSNADCVIDGYTIEYRGDRVRMADYDAPEIGSPDCPYELALGQQARRRLLELLNSGPVAVTPSGESDFDKDGHKLRLVTVSGQSVGNFLMGEGLAAPEAGAGHRHNWCG